MKTPPSLQLSELQLAIMRVLWDLGEATVAQVQEMLSVERPLAATTVATMLKRMEHRHLLKHRAEGRVFVYAPVISEDEVLRHEVGDLTHRWFQGDPTALVNHLLGSHGIEDGDLSKVRKLISQRMGGRKRHAR